MTGIRESALDLLERDLELDLDDLELGAGPPTDPAPRGGPPRPGAYVLSGGTTEVLGRSPTPAPPTVPASPPASLSLDTASEAPAEASRPSLVESLAPPPPLDSLAPPPPDHPAPSLGSLAAPRSPRDRPTKRERPSDPRGEGRTRPSEERVAPTELTALGTATEPPPAARPGLSPVERAWRVVIGLRSCGPNDEGAAVQRLLSLDKAGLDAVVRDFPGLLWFHRNLAHRKVPAGRDTSPLARALVAFGEAAVPSVADLVEDPDANRRYYAILVAADLLESGQLGDHGRRCLADALFHRFEDTDVGVRDVALQGLLTLGDDPAIAAIVRELRRRALTLGPIGPRLLALRALGVLRATAAIDDLIRLLGDTTREVQVAARKVLRVLVVDDLGHETKRWVAWRRKNSENDREGWLLAGLLHGEESIAALAGRELARITGEDLGFAPDLAKVDKKTIRAAYAARLGR